MEENKQDDKSMKYCMKCGLLLAGNHVCGDDEAFFCGNCGRALADRFMIGRSIKCGECNTEFVWKDHVYILGSLKEERSPFELVDDWLNKTVTDGVFATYDDAKDIMAMLGIEFCKTFMVDRDYVKPEHLPLSKAKLEELNCSGEVLTDPEKTDLFLSKIMPGIFPVPEPSEPPKKDAEPPAEE